MKRFSVLIFMVINLLLLSNKSFALETLSYSGRLVQTNGSPVAGPVTLRAELAYTNALTTVLCTEDIPSVTLTKGVFHIKLNLDCSASGLTLTQVLSQVPNGESVAIRITDITNISTPISYNFQALHAIPFANVASQLVQMGATNDQVLKWNNTTKKWEPGTPGGGGTVTNVSGNLPISVANGTSTPVVSISQANSTTNGYLSSTDWNTFNNKQNALPGGGNTTHYLRGDSSWQTLNTDAVTEGTKLYFENARVLLAPLTGFLPASSAIVDTDTVLSAFNKTQGQINTINTNATHFLLKDSADTLSSNVTLSGSISSTLTGDITVRDTPLGLTSAVNKGYVDSGDALKVNKSGDTISGVLTLDDDLKIKATGAGTNYVTIRANSAAANYNLVLPTSAGSTGQFLQTDGSGNLSWVAQSSTATPSGAAGGDLAGTYPNPSLKTGVVTDTHIATTLSQSKITNLTTDLASKQSTTLSSGNILVGNGSNVATAVTVSGDATLNNTGVLTLANSGVTAGTYNSVTVDGKGRVTGGTLGTTISSLGATAPITNTGTASDPVLAIDQANTTTNGYLSSTDWNTFNNKQATISKTTTQDVSKLRIYGANATNYVELSAATLTGNRSLIFPDSNGSSGNVLSTDGAGNLSWTSLSTAAPVTSVNTLTGAVTLTTTNIAEGTNQYHTSARVLATPITAPTLTNASIATSDTVQVAFGKLQAQFNNILSLALSGLSTATNAAITASDTIISAFGKLQKQITDLSGDVTTLSASNSNKLNKNTADSITATISVSGAGDILVPSTPAGMTSAVNKTYVDDRIANANNQWGTDGTNVYRTSGNVGIGTSSPGAKLEVAGLVKITGGTPGLGKVLTSDATGLASWSTVAGGDLKADGTVPMTGVMKLADGTGAAPSLSFAADLDTGIFRPANDAIAVSLNGVERLRLSHEATFNNGRLGINTTPGRALHVSQQTVSGVVAQFDSPGGSALELKKTSGVASLYLKQDASNNFMIDDNFTETNPSFFIAGATGNVGIGTTSPTAKLEVAGQVKITGGSPGAGKVLTSDASGLASWQTAGGNWVASTLASSMFSTGIMYNSGHVLISPSGSPTPGSSLNQNGALIVTRQTYDRVWYNNYNAHLQLSGSSSGQYQDSMYMGVIGTTQGNSVSYIDGNNPYNGNNNAFPLLINPSGGGVGIGLSTGGSSSTPIKPLSKLDVNGGVAIGSYSGVSAAPLNGLIVSGNVGIGTSSPGTLLDVNGVARAVTYTFPAPVGDPAPVITARTVPVGQGSANEKTELILFHSNDPANTSGNDQITLRAPALSFQTYNDPTVADINNNNGYNERMYITPTGNVGIGTTSPIAPLEVRDGPVMAGGWNRTMRLQANHPAIQLKGVSQENKSAWIEYDDATSTNSLSFRVGGTDDQVSSAIRALSITGSGVGIGTTAPGYKLDVQGGDINASGSVRAAGVALTSDIRYKEDIAPLENVLDKILKIRGVSYNWKAEEFPEKQFNDRRQIGVIAQEVERQFPEVVDTNKDGFKSVNYPALIAPLLEAVKSLYHRLLGVEVIISNKASIEALKKAENRVKELEDKNKQLEAKNKEFEKRFEKLEKLLKTK